jgi:hypothetical protein
MSLKKFSEVAKDGCFPKCGYGVMKRGANAVTSNLAVGMTATLITVAFSALRARRSSVADVEPST